MLLSPAAGAQDFGGAAALGAAGVAWPQDGRGDDLLARGLAPTSARPGLVATHTLWYGMPELSTRSLVACAGLGPARAALGASVTGENALGWRALGLGIGAAAGGGGAALNALVRDEPCRAVPGAQAGGHTWQGHDGAAGGGAWARAAPGVHVVLSVPALWTSAGASLPLEPAQAALLLGEGALSGALAWRQDADGARESAAALRLAGGPLRLYAGARARPLRSSLALAFDWRAVTLGCGVELHPVLGTSTRLALEWRAP